jgi:oligopeptide/dipeptide ABC transporter ATP-binding protein
MLVTHDLGVVAHLCRRVAIMYAGRIVETGPVRDIFKAPNHPYTRALLAAMPRLDDDPDQPLPAISGQPPSPVALATLPGCAFAPRCPSRVARCEAARPELIALSPERSVACFKATQ